MGITTGIDRAGRLVIPKSLSDRYGHGGIGRLVGNLHVAEPSGV